MSLKHFTPEQIKELSTVFGIIPIFEQEESLPVSDGFVFKESKVWWKCQDGPEQCVAEEHWTNIRNYPDVYSIAVPKTKITYL